MRAPAAAAITGCIVVGLAAVLSPRSWRRRRRRVPPKDTTPPPRPPPPTPAPPWPVFNETEVLLQKRGFSGVVEPLGAGAGRCEDCPNCSAWVAEAVETASFGPLLHRGGCRWTQLGAAWCIQRPSGHPVLCDDGAITRTLQDLQKPPRVRLSFSKEAPASGGALEVIRSPSSSDLVSRLAGDWPLRVDLVGTIGAAESFPTQSEDGEWGVDSEHTKKAEQHFGWRTLPFVKMAVLSVPIGPRRLGKVRFRRTRRDGSILPEVRTTLLWPGNATRPQIDTLVSSLIDKYSRATSKQTKNIQGQIRVLPDSEPFPPPWCRYLATERVFIPVPPVHLRLVTFNLAHWSLEALYQLWRARVGKDEAVGFVTDSSWGVWQGFAANSPALLAAVEALAPKQLPIVSGACLHRVKVLEDCGSPPAEALRELSRFLRRWLRVPPEILPAGADERLRVTTLLRWPGGTRAIANWKELSAASGDLGWDVLTPLDPEVPRGTMLFERFDRVLNDVGRSQVVVAIHGAELTVGGIAMAEGSILVEICIGGPYMKYVDYWYSTYAFTAGIHVIRWVLPYNSTSFDFQSDSVPGFKDWMHAHSHVAADGPIDDRYPVRKFMNIRESLKRSKSSTVLPVSGWRRLLAKCRRLLELQRRNTGPRPIKGLPDLPPPHPAWEVPVNTTAFQGRPTVEYLVGPR